ncbi:shikimate dehydrogenase [Deinococcus sp. QL22]|uniref:shikimate dehydrogenase family protein n=1 Tax=Deinococcus sp. QL22 TaxID=2939437 RepID=UPI00201812A9|nr:shikimate dehydrogenase [Deinococcus sp. QL22]UQN07897.1 shikimate dehydrogenase [Deinococcus sp. QL22]
MHRAAFAWAGLAGEYRAVRVPPADLGAAIAELRQPGILGANLSLPHKEATLPFLDKLTPAARAIGAVNTIIQQEGKLLGDNTDAPGLLAALADAGVSKDGAAVVLGAGGAARAAVWALRSQLGSQIRQVFVINRTRAKAARLTADLGGLAADLNEVQWAGVGLLVNASSAGLSAPDESPLPDFDFSPLPLSALIYDMVYKPAETRLMREARAAGLRAENGLGMLAHQARLAFLAWTGVDVPVRVFLDALHAAQLPIQAPSQEAEHV